ncbi:MAG: hypothetical protein RLZZ196_2656 [Bacteroidota bacterium]|jgi:hypothetical protein
MTPKKMATAKDISSEELYDMTDIEDIYESAFGSYGSKDTDYDYVDFDVDNYGYEAY